MADACLQPEYRLAADELCARCERLILEALIDKIQAGEPLDEYRRLSLNSTLDHMVGLGSFTNFAEVDSARDNDFG